MRSHASSDQKILNIKGLSVLACMQLTHVYLRRMRWRYRTILDQVAHPVAVMQRRFFFLDNILVRIELDEGELAKPTRAGRYCAGRDGVGAAQQEWRCTVLQNGTHPPFKQFQYFFHRGIGIKLHVSDVGKFIGIQPKEPWEHAIWPVFDPP